jgi:glycine dehydrogenase subunit 1
MMSELTGMDVSNASLYDGASALAEAVLMAARLSKHTGAHRVLVPATLHPLYRETIETILGNQHIELVTLPYDISTGVTDLNALKQYENQSITAMIIAQPNFLVN